MIFSDKKVLILSETPPLGYKKALDLFGISYDCRFRPSDLSDYSGLLLIGGGDVLPAFYGGNVLSEDVNFVRDKTELDAIDFFYKRGLPIMGVCRGLQILNVYFGGTLKTVNSHRENDFFRHSIYRVDTSKSLEVNSFHHQAIAKLAENGRAVYLSKDGVIEVAVFSPLVFGVQFHPERLGEEMIRLFYGKFAASFKAETNS